jgi:hypothetical protein
LSLPHAGSRQGLHFQIVRAVVLNNIRAAPRTWQINIDHLAKLQRRIRHDEDSVSQKYSFVDIGGNEEMRAP